MSYRSRSPSPRRSRSPYGPPRRSPSPRYSSHRYSRSPSPRYSYRRRSPPRYRRTPPRGPVGSERERRDSSCLFVGNLPYSFRERDVADLFDRCGPLRNVVVGVNRRTGQSKGYAFVEFEDRRDAEDAYERYQGHLVEGRRLRLDWDMGLDKKMQYAPPPRRYSPRRRSPGPRGGGYSPNRRPLSPRGRSRSPRSRSPRSRSPRSRSPSPRGRSRSPQPEDRKRSRSPLDRRSSSPAEKRAKMD